MVTVYELYQVGLLSRYPRAWREQDAVTARDHGGRDLLRVVYLHGALVELPQELYEVVDKGVVIVSYQ